MATQPIIQAAGGVVWRKRTSSTSKGTAIEVLLIHRPKYDDWTLPKGKADPGESLQQCAVREIFEETGLRVRLGVPVHQLEYGVAGGLKQVSYWSARTVGAASTESFVANDEVDTVRWARLAMAADLLTYTHDREVLARFAEIREVRQHKARVLVVLRHAQATPRNSEAPRGSDDVARSLDAAGAMRAKELIGILGSYGVRRIVSSPAIRCAQTVEPYAYSISTFLEIDDRMFEEAKPSLIGRSVAALLERKKPAVVCTHRTNLPTIFDNLGVPFTDLQPGELVVIHHRKGSVCAMEHLRI